MIRVVENIMNKITHPIGIICGTKEYWVLAILVWHTNVIQIN